MRVAGVTSIAALLGVTAAGAGIIGDNASNTANNNDRSVDLTFFNTLTSFDTISKTIISDVLK